MCSYVKDASRERPPLRKKLAQEEEGMERRKRQRERRERVCEIRAAVLKDDRAGLECSRSALDG